MYGEIQILEAADLPKQIDHRWLAKISDERLIEIHYATGLECGYYQNVAHGRRLMERADRVDNELVCRGLNYDLEEIRDKLLDKVSCQ